jgi:3',5'-cyclic-AMP phosphodiesterase
MPFRFALISDVHFGPPASHEGKLRKLGDEAEGLTRAFVRAMNEHFRPDVVVNLGDVVEDESPARDLAGYERFLSLMSGLEAEVVHVAGNHESVSLDDATLGRLWGRSGPLHYAHDAGPLRFIVLRTVQGPRSIELPEPQVAWLAAELQAADRPVVLLMHHPLSEQALVGNAWFERQPALCRVANRRAVRAVIAQSPKVIAVFNGHVHWNHLDVIGKVPYVTVQSLIENVEDDAPGRAAAAWAEVELEPRRLHIHVVGAHPQRYQFEL